MTTLEGRPIATSSGGYDRTVRVWDLAAGAQLHQLTGHHFGGVRALAVATLDGRPVAISGAGDGTVRVWDLVAGTPLLVLGIGASVGVFTSSSRNILLLGTPLGLAAVGLHRQQG